MEIMCDTTSDSSDEAETCTYEPTPDDKRFMKQARDAAKNSKDEETKVSVKAKGQSQGYGAKGYSIAGWCCPGES